MRSVPHLLPLSAAVGLWSMTAHASEPRVAVVPVAVADDFPPEVRDDARARFEEELENDAYTLISKMASGGRCADAACVHGIAQTAGAEYVVIPVIELVETDYRVTIEVYDFAGNPKGSEDAICEICTHEDTVALLLTYADAIEARLVKLIDNPYLGRAPAEPEEKPPPHLYITTNPPGALVEVDGTSLGMSPLNAEVEPGLRNLVVRKRGFMPIEMTVRGVRGETTQLDLELDESDREKTQRLRVAGLTSSIVSIPFLAAGATLIALDGRPYQGNCEGDNVDDSGNCRYRYDTVVGGAVLTGVGVAWLIAGATSAIVAFGRRHREEEAWKEFEEDKIRVVPISKRNWSGLQFSF